MFLASLPVTKGTACTAFTTFITAYSRLFSSPLVKVCVLGLFFFKLRKTVWFSPYITYRALLNKSLALFKKIIKKNEKFFR